MGMVRVPVTATLPAADPEIMPSNVLKITAVLAPAATMLCVTLRATRKKKSPAPNSLRNAPYMVNRMM